MIFGLLDSCVLYSEVPSWQATAVSRRALTRVRIKSEKSCDVDVMGNHGTAAADCTIQLDSKGHQKPT